MQLFLGRRPNLALELQPSPPPEALPEAFAIAEGFANAYRPDVLWVKARTNAKLDFSDEASRIQELMDSSTGGAPVHYREHGVGGLGIRTVFGPLLADQTGRDLLATLPKPAVVRELEWGGVLIDLVDAPWAKQMTEVRESWVACMKHLESNPFMTKLELLPNGAVRRTVPKTREWNPGGLVT